MSAQTALTKFDGVLVTIRSKKSFFEVTKAIESSLQRFSVPRLMEYVAHADRDGLEAYVDAVSAPSKFSIFWEMEQGPTMRLAGIPIESKFYLVGNAVIARGLFRYTSAAGLGAPVRICVSQRDGEETRIDLDQVSAFFSKFPETAPSDVPQLLDAEMVKVFEDAAAQRRLGDAMGCHSHRARRHRRTDHAPRPPLALFTSAAKPDESTDATATVDTGRDPDRRPARQGEHSEEVLRELGYSDDEICHFTNGGVLLHTRDTK